MVSLRRPSALPVVGVLVDARTYKHLLYLLIAVPLGLLYSTLFSFALVFGLLLSVALVGLVILLAALLGSRLVAGFERRLANALLGTELSRPDDLAAADGALAGVRTYVDARSTWTGLGFLSLKFWVSLVALVPLLLLANALPLVAAPLRYPYAVEFGEANGEPVTWAIDALPEAAAALALGVVGVLLALHVANLVAYAARRMAVALLGRPEKTESEAAGSQTADGAAGEFDFVDDPVPVERDGDGPAPGGGDDGTP